VAMAAMAEMASSVAVAIITVVAVHPLSVRHKAAGFAATFAVGALRPGLAGLMQV